jgi:hypothetical protein
MTTPTPDQTELEIVLEKYKSNITSLHHRIKYQKLDLTPDEILAKEDIVTNEALAAISKLTNKRVVAELDAISQQAVIAGYPTVIQERLKSLKKGI